MFKPHLKFETPLKFFKFSRRSPYLYESGTQQCISYQADFKEFDRKTKLSIIGSIPISLGSNLETLNKISSLTNHV